MSDRQVTIGGDVVTLGDFSAFKALLAVELVTETEHVYRDVLNEAARFKREYEAENFIEMDRTEARRQFGPRVMRRLRQEEQEDGRVAVHDEAVLHPETGQPVLGPDPLGHLTEADWEASGQKLRVPESPRDEFEWAAMLPIAFKRGRTQVFRLLALALTSNRDLETWDMAGDPIEPKLDETAKELMHRAKADELVRLAQAVIALCRDQLGAPFEEVVAQIRLLAARRRATQEETATETPPPMRAETEADDAPETPNQPTSSTPSPDGTEASPPSGSTEPVGASSSSSATA